MVNVKMLHSHISSRVKGHRTPHSIIEKACNGYAVSRSIAVFFNTDAWLAGRTKGADFGLLKLQAGGLPEKLQIFRVAARPSALNISYTQIVQLAGYLQFVINGEG